MYDYLSFARESASQLNFDGAMGLRGVPSGRDWPDAWRSAGEMGARKAMRRAAREPGSFADAWAADHSVRLRSLPPFESPSDFPFTQSDAWVAWWRAARLCSVAFLSG